MVGGGGGENRYRSRVSPSNEANGLEWLAQDAVGGAQQGCHSLCIQGGLPGGAMPEQDLGGGVGTRPAKRSGRGCKHVLHRESASLKVGGTRQQINGVNVIWGGSGEEWGTAMGSQATLSPGLALSAVLLLFQNTGHFFLFGLGSAYSAPSDFDSKYASICTYGSTTEMMILDKPTPFSGSYLRTHPSPILQKHHTYFLNDNVFPEHFPNKPKWIHYPNEILLDF